MKKKINFSLVIVFLTGALVFNQSCREPLPPKAIVYVVDENNNAVEGARVIVKAANSQHAHTVVYTLDEAKAVADTKFTNSDGKVLYDFKYEAIYNVEVSKNTDRENPFVRRGIGVLILENDKTTNSKIEIREQNW